LIAQTDRARVGSIHPSIKGASIEHVIRRTLTDYLPSRFKVNTGQIANSCNRISPQLDIIIHDTDTFPRLSVNEDSSVVVCSESVFEIVECKSRLDVRGIHKHFTHVAGVESQRHGIFGKPGMAAGYFVLVVDRISPDLAGFESDDRFVGFYSLKGSKCWWSPCSTKEFRENEGNGLDLFMHHILYDCMRKGFVELGSLDYTYD